MEDSGSGRWEDRGRAWKGKMWKNSVDCCMAASFGEGVKTVLIGRWLWFWVIGGRKLTGR